MNREREYWWVPLTGVVFVVLVLVGGFVTGGEAPDAGSPVNEIVDHWVDNESGAKAAAAIALIAVGALLFFAAHLRKVLRAAEGEGHTLSALVLPGATLVAVGFTIDAAISYSLADRAEDLEPAAVQALQAIWDTDFLPVLLGAGVFMLASGLSIVRHGALPSWLGWVAVVVGAIAFVGAAFEPGFISLPLTALWILVVSVMLTMRARSERPAAGPAPGTGA